MNRFEEGTIILGKMYRINRKWNTKIRNWIDSIRKTLRNRSIRIWFIRNLAVKYEPIIDLVDQQSQPQSHEQSNTQPPRNTASTSTPIFSSSWRSTAGQPSITFYTDYGNERDDLKPRGKRFPLRTIDKKLLLDDGRFLNLIAHDP